MWFNVKIANLILRFCLFLWLLTIPIVGHCAEKEHVLVLHSYHENLPWSKGLMEGIFSVFSNPDLNVELHVEYIDHIRHAGDELFPYLEALYVKKFEYIPLKVIIPTDDIALDFLLERRNRLFPGVPIVFCAPNDFKESRIAGHGQITGVAETPEIKGTIDLILHLHPKTSRIAIVSDKEPASILRLSQLNQVKPAFENRVEFIELTDAGLSELKEELNHLSNDTVVLFMTFLKDRFERKYSNNLEILAELTHSCNLPFYTYKRIDVGHGVIGGVVISEELMARQASEMAVKILRGESADQIPVSYKTPTVTMFDYFALKRFGISESDLPEGSIVINRQSSFYEKNKWLVWRFLVIITILVVFIVLLLLNVLRRKRVERELKKAHDELEQRISDRTAELTRVNAELKEEIGKHKQTEDELKKINDYLESILEDSPDVIAIVDGHGRFVKWSRMAEEIYGSEFDGIAGKKAFEFYADDAERDRMLDQLRRDGFIKRYEIEVKRKDGSTFPVEISISLLRDKENRTIGSVAVLRDLSEMKKTLTALRIINNQLSTEIAERRKIEEALKESENQYRAIFENTGNATLIVEEDMSISLVNSEFEKFMGYSRREVEGRKWTELVAKEDLARMREYHELRRSHPDMAPKHYEFRYVTKQKEIKNAFLTVNLIPGSRKSIVSVIDVTERKKREEELLKVQKLESVGLLAGGIAHDFNNILTAVIGNLSLAKLYANPNDKIFSKLEETERASLRAKELTRQLLTFSKGGEPIRKTMFIGELIKDSTIFALRGSNVRSEFSVSGDLWAVEVDEGQISQVMHNLIINADQAMPEGGIVRVSAENIVTDASFPVPLRPGKYVKVSVSDEGMGISNDHLPKVFDPYFTTKRAGSGLGLATAHSIINKHDGHILVESEPGRGTTFHFYLPASEKETVQIESPEEEVLMGKGRVLVMDDEEIVREIATEMLIYLGYEVTLAKDGAEAIRIYQETLNSGKPFDVVLMDLTIPGGMGGKEAISRLLEIDPEIKAIVSSGYSEDPTMADFRSSGFAGVVSKPYKVGELGEVLHKVLERAGE